jgi:hypothetical protein
MVHPHARCYVDLDILCEHVFEAFHSWATRWAAVEIDSAEFRNRFLYAVYVGLVAAATDEGRPVFGALLREVEKSLRKRATAYRVAK